jgi:hypothetical protein
MLTGMASPRTPKLTQVIEESRSILEKAEQLKREQESCHGQEHQSGNANFLIDGLPITAARNRRVTVVIRRNEMVRR